MSDRIAVFNRGRIEQIGAPAEVYERPASAFVAGFVGISNVIERGGKSFAVRPEKIRMLDAARTCPAGPRSRAGSARSSTRAWSRATWSTSTAAASCMVVQQNLETSSAEALDQQGRNVGSTGAQNTSSRSTRNGGNGRRAMSKRHRRALGWSAVALLVGALAFTAAGCGSSKKTPSSSAPSLPTKIGPGEGKLNLIAWEGYTQPQWVKPFEQQTGCQVTAKYAGSSDEMVTLMRQGGGAQYDMVSASGDASLRLIYGERRPARQPRPDPGLQELHPGAEVAAAQHRQRRPLRDLAAVGAQHAALQHEQGEAGADELGGDLRPEVQGQDHRSGQPDPDRRRRALPVEDAADLGIKDPYELNQKQFDAAVSLLKQQRPLMKKYWALASDEIDLFKNGDAVIGAAWPYQTNTLAGRQGAGQGQDPRARARPAGPTPGCSPRRRSTRTAPTCG